MALNRWRTFSEAYQQASYVVSLPRGNLVLRAGQRDSNADRRLWHEAGVRKYWVMLSASNPHSRLVSESWNTQRFKQLRRLLAARRYRLFHSFSRDPTTRWPDERGFLICGISMRQAMALGRRLGQNALVTGRPGNKPKILWL